MFITVVSSSAALLTPEDTAVTSVWVQLTEQRLSQDGCKGRGAEPSEQGMDQTEGSARCQPSRARSFLRSLNLHFGNSAHDSVHLCDLLLLSQSQEQGTAHLSQCSLHKQNYLDTELLKGKKTELRLRKNSPLNSKTCILCCPLRHGESCRETENSTQTFKSSISMCNGYQVCSAP